MTKYGLVKKADHWEVAHPDYPHGEAIWNGSEWEAHSSRDHGVTAHCETLEEAAQFLYYG